MILVMGHLRLPPGKAAELRGFLAAHAAATRAEDGCEDYNWSFDAADPDLVRVAERWETPDALAAHGEADHQRELNRTLRANGVSDVSVKAWDGAFWRTLIGD